ncbi:CLUMA_CG008175, isoform A [Clunio marinus]|uniref:CLUMA_CG008175, isoform A n=1 Tax=Clunio marinus TaxID=568069 RepID=A0A1J1I3A2_9DIPT|nr:CLUMA_CG008175, isoform A [Clunio marinus]
MNHIERCEEYRVHPVYVFVIRSLGVLRFTVICNFNNDLILNRLTSTVNTFFGWSQINQKNHKDNVNYFFV